jgi:hypothetical protein
MAKTAYRLFGHFDVMTFEILGLIPYVTANIMDDTPPVNRSRTREMKLKRTVEYGSKNLQEALLYSTCMLY